MALPVEWTKEAEITYLNIVISIGEKWTQREVKNFLERTEQVLAHISKFPLMYPYSKMGDAHRAVVSKHTLLQSNCSKNSIVELALRAMSLS